jgi:FKBP-type peptidyl-prolyl cis-trans isomerase (trigger factor)
MRRYAEQNKQNWQEIENSEEFSTLKQSKFDEAKQRVLTSLVLGAVVRSENLAVSEQELVPYLAEVIARYELPFEKAIHNEELRRQVAEEVLTNKVVEFVVSSAQVKYVPDTQEHHDHDEHEGHSHDHHQSSSEKGTKKPDSTKKTEKQSTKS